jgi:hypothetical protein
MKKKTINAVLLIGVLIIWIIVIKRSFNFFGSKKEEVAISITPPTNLPTFKFEKDTFLISNFDRDPFLDKHSKKTKTSTLKPRINHKQPVKTKKKVFIADNTNWPKLKYFGYLKGNNQSEKLAVIKIDGKLHRVREKSNIDDIGVLKVYKDSVSLKRNGKTIMVYK